MHIADMQTIVRDILQANGLPDLVNDFSYFIEIDHHAFNSTEEVVIGASRTRGLPYLPKALPWPTGFYFLVQLNLAEVQAFDRFKLLPDSGMLYIFFDPGATDFRPYSKTAAKIIYAPAATHCELRPIPPPSDFPKQGGSYYSSLTKPAVRMKFQAAFTFSVKVDHNVTDQLERSLQARYIKESGCTIFGKPLTWQGEDEGTLFCPEDWDWIKQGPPPSPPGLIMLFQDHFFDSMLHFWISRQNLALRNFEEIFVTASTT